MHGESRPLPIHISDRTNENHIERWLEEMLEILIVSKYSNLLKKSLLSVPYNLESQKLPPGPFECMKGNLNTNVCFMSHHNMKFS